MLCAAEGTGTIPPGIVGPTGPPQRDDAASGRLIGDSNTGDNMRKIVIGWVCVAALAGGLPLWADTLQLKDGTSVAGRVMDEGTNYWVKGADGTSHIVPKDSVQQWVKGDAAASPAAASSASLAGRGQAASLPAGASFKAVKAKADRVDTPIQAVALWQSFLDNHPSPADASAAKQQLTYWKQLVDGQAERVNGKWIWGAERTKLLKQVRDLLKQARKDLDSNQTLTGIHELEQASKLYPNDFWTNFELGYINLSQGVMGRNNAKVDAGLKAMETAVKLRPNCAAALSDLAVAYHFKRQYGVSAETAFRAAKIEDSKEIVQNLVNCIVDAPAQMKESSRIKPILEQAMVLASKYGIGGGSDMFDWVRPGAADGATGHHGDDDEKDDSEQKGPPGIIGNGTGELVSADGYILTNRHVAKEGDYLMVRLSDGTMKVADRVVIDDEQDMAIIKIKTDAPLPFVRLASYNQPPVGEDVDVFGFPIVAGVASEVNASVKMTRGIVTAYEKDQDMCDVTVDAQINPGNSGGPMVDHFGNLLAITHGQELGRQRDGGGQHQQLRFGPEQRPDPDLSRPPGGQADRAAPGAGRHGPCADERGVGHPADADHGVRVRLPRGRADRRRHAQAARPALTRPARHLLADGQRRRSDEAVRAIA